MFDEGDKTDPYEWWARNGGLADLFNWSSWSWSGTPNLKYFLTHSSPIRGRVIWSGERPDLADAFWQLKIGDVISLDQFHAHGSPQFTSDHTVIVTKIDRAHHIFGVTMHGNDQKDLSMFDVVRKYNRADTKGYYWLIRMVDSAGSYV